MKKCKKKTIKTKIQKKERNLRKQMNLYPGLKALVEITVAIRATFTFFEIFIIDLWCCKHLFPSNMYDAATYNTSFATLCTSIEFSIELPASFIFPQMKIYFKINCMLFSIFSPSLSTMCLSSLRSVHYNNCNCIILMTLYMLYSFIHHEKIAFL